MTAPLGSGSRPNDPWLATALVGTGNSGELPSLPPPLDELTPFLPPGEASARLTLQAGLWGVARIAGYRAKDAAAAVSPAEAETRPACSPRAAQWVRDMLAGHEPQLLPELLDRMARAGQRLPHDLLPLALQARDSGGRRLLEPVLGGRGAWLRQFRESWQWSTAATAGAQPASPDAWDELPRPARAAALAAVRTRDPALARSWLIRGWKREPADVRAELLESLRVGLSAEDLEFLTQAAGDRSQKVRAAACDLLAELPGSPFAVRLRARAEAAFPLRAQGLAERKPRLGAAPPAALDDEAERDGVVREPPPGIGQRAWWLTQILARVPPAHWTVWFAAEPETLLEAAAGDAWGAAVCEGWSRAALRFGAADWAGPLWDWWSQESPAADARSVAGDFLPRLVALMPAEETERRSAAILAGGGQWPIAEALEALPRPWSVATSRAWLGAMRQRVSRMGGAAATDLHAWLQSASIAAAALAAECFAEAEEDWKIPETNGWWEQAWRREMHRFQSVLQLRRQIHEEIPL